MGLGSGSNSMTYADTNQFITYQDRNTLTRYTDDIWRPDVPSGIPGVTANMVGKIKADVTGPMYATTKLTPAKIIKGVFFCVSINRFFEKSPTTTPSILDAN